MRSLSPRGTWPIFSQRSWIERSAALAPLRSRCRWPRPRRAAPPSRRGSPRSRRRAGPRAALRAAKKASCAARNRVQSASSSALPARPGGLPPRHQVAVGAGGRAPVGGALQALGLGDEGLLDLLGLAALAVEPGEVLATVLVELRARVAEPLPQRLLAGAVGARRCLPVVEQGLEPLPGGLPLGRLREGLGLGDDRLAGGERGGLGRGARLGGRRALLGDERRRARRPAR